MPNTEARDYFERYFAEKLWTMIPEAFREEDGLATPPGVLRAFIETLAGHAAVLRRSQDKLWDDQLIELCSEWAVPYIGELVGTRMVSALNRRGRRIDVAKTIYYRRRKGTPRILEELVADITGWEGKLVEEFRRLGRLRHGLDPAPVPLAGRFTGTLPGGLADLRNTRGAELASGPFDEFHHTPDYRRPNGRDGRHGIAKLAFHLYRLASTALDNVQPAPGPSAGTFLFDPSGRDIPLFIRRHRTDDRDQFNWEDWQTAQEWELPAPMNCRVLNHAEYIITAAALATLRPLLITPGGLSGADATSAVAQLMHFRRHRFPTEARLRTVTGSISPAFVTALQVEAVWEEFLRLTLIEECGKQALLSPGGVNADTSDASVYVRVGNAVPTRQNTAAGNLSTWALTVSQREWVIDPARGRLLWVGAGAAPTPLVGHYYGFSGPIGAGGYDRSDAITTSATLTISGGGAIAATNPSSGVTEISDSRTYTSVGNRSAIDNLEIRAANRQRPYLVLAQNWALNTNANTEATLLIDGLWVGATGAPRAIELRGDYETVTIRHATFDPGGVDAQNQTIPPVTLRVVGSVERLIIEHSIVGPIRLGAGGSVERIEISDSIVDGRNIAGNQAIDIANGEVSLERVTVFGELNIEWLYASETFITGFADVTNTQEGCFRFSAVLERRNPLQPPGPGNPQTRVPRPYESYLLPSTTGFFTSTVFGQPGYAQLSEAAPESLQRGAENGSEIGAFSSLLNPIKADSLSAKVDEFAPFGVLPFTIFET
ncbi:MAG TPA: hypothetical protein VHO24_13460 [Opitutaceae bacterium]|nr:hypothetical protein [Opitutaceae bacterium]